jgi:DNA-binding response OmpR family regulator
MSRPPESAKRILFVDDDEDTCEMMRILLEQTGYAIRTAGTIADALNLARTERFDLYILDNWIPYGTGIELCKQLRVLYPKSPILFYSGVGQESEIQTAMAAGANGYLVKPCEVELLQSTIVRLLKKKNLPSQMRQSKQLVSTSGLLIKESKKRWCETQQPGKEKDQKVT